jgi:alpha-D-xyloside xylohydrolase
MLTKEPGSIKPWQWKENQDHVDYTGKYGTVRIDKNAWGVQLFNAAGELIVSTLGGNTLKSLHPKFLPFLFVKRSSDYTRSIAASFSLLPGERIYGCGESYTALNKRGQKLVLCTSAAQSTATGEMYKPIPFFMSNKGYGMFFHTGSPVTMDIGCGYDGTNTTYIGEDQLDVFFFIGSPQEILSEYTALTGKSPLPPLWSFGLWMSRFSYSSESEVKEVADKLREFKIPCDVIHIDAGWFERGYNCDFKFAKEKFPDPSRMVEYLRKKCFRVSLWQIPYFSPPNPIFPEVVSKKLFIKDGNGHLATDDAILDFSNDKAKEWYKEKILSLLDLGISAIKADFGEAAPLHGYYASGRSGYYEHALYPLRYTSLLHEITFQKTGEHIIWARSAWAGGQRNPIHWGGDPEVSDTGMTATLRGGLSLGLCGFSFWSHDIGGFFTKPKEELFKRWALFGMLSSHSRVHGFPPREPWEFNKEFLHLFRKISELKYRLMPYIYSQAAVSSANGWPMLRTLFFEFPEDATSWFIEDQYMLGESILVAPLLEENTNKRQVYLPPGKWIDYQTRKVYDGAQWIMIGAGELPGIILVKDGSIIPRIQLAQSTDEMDWSAIDLIVFSDENKEASTIFVNPETGKLSSLKAIYKNSFWKMANDPGYGQTRFTVIPFC